MSYAAHLRQLLRPLGVYDLTPQSLSGGELEALGEAFDELYAQMEIYLQESLPTTAENSGLRAYETLFSHPTEMLETPDARRQAVLGLLRQQHGGATPASLAEAARFTGAAVSFDESALPQTLTVQMPGAIQQAQRQALEDYLAKLLPCHLTVRYQYE